MKKRIALIMTAVMVCLSAAGCGGKNTGAASSAASETQAVEAQPEAAEAVPETKTQPETEMLPVPEADDQPAPEAVAEEMKDAPADAAESAEGENTDSQAGAEAQEQTKAGSEASAKEQAEADVQQEAGAEVSADAQEGSQSDGQTSSEAQSEAAASAGTTAEIAEAVEESRVPQQIRDLLVGEWQDMTSQRAGMDITEGEEAEGKDFHAQIYWSGSYKDRMVWDMNLEYDPVSGELTYKGGRKAEVTYGEDGMIEKEDVKWEDAEGTFTLAEGALSWKDSKQEDAGDFVFVRVYSYDITPEEFKTNLFDVLSHLESGTAGSSLKAAKAAQEILQFAADRQVWNVDAIARRASITEAWEGLSSEEKKLVKQSFGKGGGVSGLIDDAFKDYEPVRGNFEDAGVGDEMKALTVNVYAQRSWKALRELMDALQ